MNLSNLNNVPVLTLSINLIEERSHEAFFIHYSDFIFVFSTQYSTPHENQGRPV